MFHLPENETRIDPGNPFNCESLEERRRRVRCHAFGECADLADALTPIAEGCADFAIVWSGQQH